MNVSSAEPVGAPEPSAKILSVTVTLLERGESNERVTEFSVYSKLSVVNEVASQLFPEKVMEPELDSPRLLTTCPARPKPLDNKSVIVERIKPRELNFFINSFNGVLS